MPTEQFSMTSSLNILLRDEILSEQETNAIAEALIDGTDAMRASAEVMPPILLAREIHDEIDVAIAKRQANPISQSEEIACTKGCAHCCYQIVACAPAEAQRLLYVAEKKNLTIDRAKLQRQEGRNDTTWLKQPREDMACVFLGPDNLCQVYDDRPASCRKYFTISAPPLCDLSTNSSGKTKVWFAIGAEILTSAMFTGIGSGFLPDLLLAEMRRSHE